MDGRMDWHAFAIWVPCAVSMCGVVVKGTPVHLTGRRGGLSYTLGARKRTEAAVVLAAPERAGTGGGAGSGRGQYAPHGSPADVLRDSMGGGAVRASERVGPCRSEPRRSIPTDQVRSRSFLLRTGKM